MNKPNPFIITGGHHNSALVIAEALRVKGYSIVWLGTRRTMIGDPHDSLEFQEITEAGFPFINLIAGKFHRQAHPLHLLRIPLGFIQAFILLTKIKPRLILSFGGYMAVPVALIGRLLKIPVITFEQTTVIGRANELISKFSVKNFLSWDSSLKYFPLATSVVVGLPLRKEIWDKSFTSFFANKRLTLLITGGKQGAHKINQTIFTVLPELIKHYNLIHLTGASRKTRDFNQATKIRTSLPRKLQSRYQVFAHLPSLKMISALKSADIIISRSGAHISYEILALAKPSLLIPLPFSYHNEQYKNAQTLVDAGSAILLPQNLLTDKTLLAKLTHIHKNLNTFLKHSSSTSGLIKKDATHKVVSFILKHYPKVR